MSIFLHFGSNYVLNATYFVWDGNVKKCNFRQKYNLLSPGQATCTSFVNTGLGVHHYNQQQQFARDASQYSNKSGNR